MSDLAAVLLAVATAAGALAARPVSIPMAVVTIALAFAVRRPVLLALGSALLASSLSAAAWAGLRPPAPRSVDATVTLLRDPATVGGAVRAVVRVGHRHVEMTARGAPGRVLGDRLAGERVRVGGTLEPLSTSVRARLARQHVAAALNAHEVRAAGDGNVPSRLANRLRRVLVRGASSLPREERTLFTGFVLGDDRGQSIETVDDFRSSGLSHLLVVSGENVAFALALAGPMLRRLPLSWRLLAGLVVLGLFGVLTRWEPSVLRAEAMAAIAMTASAIGRPVSTIRLLALAVTGLLLIDPLLVGSVGFLLSVGACAGIALFAQPLAASLPGPRPVASATGVTLAAQAGVAPVLLPAFGALPVATLPANLLAMPAAGPVMVWGMLAGVPAGLVGGWPAAVLHLPTRVLVGWIALVARTTARAPLGRLGFGGLLVIGTCVAVAVGSRRARTVGLAGAVAALCAPAVALALTHPPPVDGREVVPGARLWRAGGATVLVIDHPRPDRLLEALRAGGVTRLTVLVARRSGTRTAQAVEPVLHRLHVDAVLEPGVPAGSTIRAGPYVITVKATRPKLDVTIEAQGSGR